MTPAQPWTFFLLIAAQMPDFPREENSTDWMGVREGNKAIYFGTRTRDQIKNAQANLMCLTTVFRSRRNSPSFILVGLVMRKAIFITALCCLSSCCRKVCSKKDTVQNAISCVGH